MSFCDAVPKIIGCFSKPPESVFCFCIIYTNYHLWPFLKHLACVWQSLSHCERHSVCWNAPIKACVPLQLAQFVQHHERRHIWGIFSKEGFEKTFWAAARQSACGRWKKIPSVPSTKRESHCAGCFEPALWLPGRLAHSPAPEGPCSHPTESKHRSRSSF